jgi:hypothetical protein
MRTVDIDFVKLPRAKLLARTVAEGEGNYNQNLNYVKVNLYSE